MLVSGPALKPSHHKQTPISIFLFLFLTLTITSIRPFGAYKEDLAPYVGLLFVFLYGTMKRIPYYPSTIALPMLRHDAVFFVIVTLTSFFFRVGKHHTYLYSLYPDMR